MWWLDETSVNFLNNDLETRTRSVITHTYGLARARFFSATVAIESSAIRRLDIKWVFLAFAAFYCLERVASWRRWFGKFRSEEKWHVCTKTSFRFAKNIHVWGLASCNSFFFALQHHLACQWSLMNTLYSVIWASFKVSNRGRACEHSICVLSFHTETRILSCWVVVVSRKKGFFFFLHSIFISQKKPFLFFSAEIDIDGSDKRWKV